MEALATTERLVLRPLREADAEAYHRLWAHPRVHCYEGERLESLEAAREAIRRRQTARDGSELAAALRETDAFLGALFGRWERDAFSVCWNFLPEAGGQGYALEAARAYLDLLFTRFGARRVYAYVEENNLPSQRLCRRLGMRQEGLFREFVSFVNGPDGAPLYENTLQFALLKKEWAG